MEDNMKKFALYLSILVLAFASGMFLENIFASDIFQADIEEKVQSSTDLSSTTKASVTNQTTEKSYTSKVNQKNIQQSVTDDSSTESTTDSTTKSLEQSTSSEYTKSTEKTKETKESTETKQIKDAKNKEATTKNSSTKKTQNENKVAKSKNQRTQTSKTSVTQKQNTAKQQAIQPAPKAELKALQTIELQVQSTSPASSSLLYRDLTPTLNHKQAVNHLYLQPNATIYQSPSTAAEVVAGFQKYRGYTAISRKSVENEMGIWYQIAFPDTTIGWVQEKQTKNRNQDYYFYTTGGPHPNLAMVENLSIEVSITKKRVYVKANNQVIYTMLCQTARDGYETPTGNYQVNDYRATSFWSTFGGADYAVGWKDGGLYLFHSVDKASNEGPYVKSQGLKLGVTQVGTSHGCIQLAIEDAKWFYQQLPVGTPVSVF